MGQVDFFFFLICWDVSTWRNSCQSDPSGLLRVRLQSWKHGRLMAPAAWQCSRIQQGLNFIFLAVCGAGWKRKSCTSASCNAEQELLCFLLWESRPAFLEDTEEIKISLAVQCVSILFKVKQSKKRMQQWTLTLDYTSNLLGCQRASSWDMYIMSAPASSWRSLVFEIVLCLSSTGTFVNME